ncbi:TetR/AcrR family transcriptional regulator [Actinoplanes sp. ATCC 53533]|uniref:TetR/AcrR family transcriptional regulator n=1 Tax=Actinoplanes sp. ATCC 53533 TaxID=1288362 RepID=UPI000F782BA4|nr:TetR/AcrR family transcriptional regulator [Actinoplanes sp. ATCC 53533]RSM62045.1 TetR/AcrR family transcriptional regulator [Actinoplanes sp. ATCC 53533]
MPKLWDTTIEAHRRTVREAILETTWALVREHGLMSVTMSQIAKQAGVGRATLYKYFPDVEAILAAHHERHVAGHLTELAELRAKPSKPYDKLQAVLGRYALICYYRKRHGTEELAALLHRGERVSGAEQQLIDLFQDLLAEVAAAGELRDDVAPDELATYCLHALGAAGSLPSEAAVNRLVAVALTGLRPTRRGSVKPDAT